MQTPCSSPACCYSHRDCFTPTFSSSFSWIPWFIDIYTADAADRNALGDYLKAEQQIGSRKVYPPIHTQEAYSKPEYADQPAGIPLGQQQSAFPVTNERYVASVND